MNKLRILIADDHRASRRGLRQFIELEPGLEVVAEAEDGQSALEGIRALKPQIAILDLRMPKLDGLEVARLTMEESLGVSIIFLTMYAEEKLLNHALEVGAKGYVLKDSAATEIVRCIRAVAAGEHYSSPTLAAYLETRNPSRSERSSLDLEVLTPTERRVLGLLADYKTTKEIGEELSISRSDVEMHRANICQKLHIEGSHSLMKFALGHKAFPS